MSGPPNATETVFVAAPITGARGNVIASPFQYLMTGEDNLVVTGWADASATVIVLTGRFLKPDGAIQPFVRRLVAGTTAAGAAELLNLGPGFLLNLSMIAEAAGVQWGQLYTRVDVVRGSVGARIVLGTLLAGYVTSTTYLAWPGSPVINPWEGAGYLRAIVPSPLGPGVTPSFTAGALQRINLIAASGNFVTDGDTGTNRPQLTLLRTSLVQYEFPSIRFHNGNEQCFHQWSSGYGGGSQIAGFSAHNALPADVWLLPGDVLSLTASSFDAGDEFSSVEFLVRQYLTL